MLYSAGADIKAFTQMDETSGAELINSGHGLLRDFGRSKIATIAAVNGLAFGGGCELAMSCDVRLAAQSALFGQPEIKLGIIPGFGGTQRLPRLVGENKALEMNLIGDPIGAEGAYEYGLVNRVVPDHELLDTALAWGRRLAEQAPLAVQAVKEVSAKGDLDEGIEAEKAALRAVFAERRRQGGHQRLPRQAQAELDGDVSVTPASARAGRAARRADPRGALGRRADRRRDLRPIGDPGLPLARARACGRTSTRWRSRTSTPGAPTPSASGTSTASASPRSSDKQPNGAHAALVELERRGQLDAVITQNIDMLHRKAGSGDVVEVHGTIEHSSCLDCREPVPLDETRARLRADERRRPALLTAARR